MDEYDFEADLIRQAHSFETDLIRRSLSDDSGVAKEAAHDLLDIVVSHLQSGTLSSSLQIWLGYRLGAVIDDDHDAREALLTKRPMGRPRGIGSLRVTDEQASVMEEYLVLSMKTTRAEAVRILADGLCVDVETVTTALKRAKKHGFGCRDWPVTHLIGELPLRLREFIQSLTRTNS